MKKSFFVCAFIFFISGCGFENSTPQLSLSPTKSAKSVGKKTLSLRGTSQIPQFYVGQWAGEVSYSGYTYWTNIRLSNQIVSTSLHSYTDLGLTCNSTLSLVASGLNAIRLKENNTNTSGGSGETCLSGFIRLQKISQNRVFYTWIQTATGQTGNSGYLNRMF